MKTNLKQLRRLEDERNAQGFFDPELAEALNAVLQELYDWRTTLPEARRRVWQRRHGAKMHEPGTIKVQGGQEGGPSVGPSRRSRSSRKLVRTTPRGGPSQR
jgi:hypothetical protein